MLSFTPLISPHPLAVPRYHQGPTSREAGGGGDQKPEKRYCFTVMNQEKRTLVHFREGNILGQFTCCLCNFTSLRSCSTSIFSFSFSGKSSMWRAGIFAPEPGPGTALEVERLEAQHTRARPEITAVPAHPARRPARTTPPPACYPEPQELSCLRGVPSRLPCVLGSFLGPHDRGRPAPASPGGLSGEGAWEAGRCRSSGWDAGPLPAPEPATPSGDQPGLRARQLGLR